jgi:AraC-like DNA-binding protein
MFVLEERYAAGSGRWHMHRRAQLLHPGEGVLVVESNAGRWVVPPQRAVWILPGVMHRVSSNRPYGLRTLYAEASALCLPGACSVVSVDPMASELLRAAAAFGMDYPERGPEDRLMAVILDRLPWLAVAPLNLRYPTDARLQRIADALMADPADRRTLDELAVFAAASSRTVARRFVTETGQTFAQWRQQARLLAALERLGAGQSVTTVALDVGYADVSSFIAVFKASLGETPAKYFAGIA